MRAAAAPPDHRPVWPAKHDTELPTVRPLPLVDPHAPWWRRLLACLRRTQYRFVEDYFTWCPWLGAWIFIPKNFVYDMASVPRIGALLFSPSGIWAYPAGPHDFGYRFGGLYLSFALDKPYNFWPMTRRDIDRVFLDLADKATGLRTLNRSATATLRLLGSCNYQPRPLDGVDWTKPVSP